MSDSNKLRINELAETFRTLWFDLPSAGWRWSLGLGGQDEFAAVVWKGYDAGVKVATDFMVGLVKSPTLNEIVANASIANYGALGIVDQMTGRAAQRKVASLQGQINSLSEEIEELRGAKSVVRPSERRIATVGSRRAKREAASLTNKPQLAVA
jgi:hypothetical protein